MIADQLALASIETVAEKIAAKEISPVELTQAMLERIERLNPQLNAYMTVTADIALEQARAAEREIVAGNHRGLLHGVPIAHKDLYATKGVRTTAGSKILTDWIPDHEATVVTKLRDAGAVMLGKLGMHEWAFGTTSANVHFGYVCNPWRVDCVPGGSSGGSGAAVAAGLAFAALGSDTGGSIRIPASFCGVVGLMPTYGRASLHGAVPLSRSLDHPGPLTRTVRDAAIVTQAISGHDPLDPATELRPVDDMLADAEQGPEGLRIGVPKQLFWDNLEPEVERLVRKAIADLAAAGADVQEVDWPEASVYSSAVGPIILAEAAAYHAQYLPARRAEYSDVVGGMLEAGAQIKATQYIDAMRIMERARSGEADRALDDVDVLMTPQVQQVAPKMADVLTDRDVVRRTALTSLIDLTGQPAMSVPCGVSSQAMPVGLQIIGRRWDEAAVVRAGRAYEMVRGPFPAPPIS
ncbi:MAG: amidase [Dehalococcoidia bacterium]